MKRLLVRAGVVLGSLVLALFGAEYAARWLDPFGISYYRDNSRYFAEAIVDCIGEPGGRGVEGRLFQQKPGVDLELVTFRFRTDAFGLRSAEAGRPLPDPDPEQRLRMLCLGDSVTLAWGVDDEHSWARVLERAGRSADGRELEVLNGGHLMYETVQQADLLRAWAPALQPEIVAVMVIANDLVSSYGSIEKDFAERQEEQEGSSRPAIVSGAQQRARRAFPALAGLWRYYGEAEQLAGIPEYSFGTIDNLPGYPEGWPRMRAAFEDLRSQCAALSAHLVILDHTIPKLPELEAWCTEAGVDRIDTTFTDTEWREEIRNSKADSHFNPRGNAYIAAKALSGLRNLGLLAHD